jgi:hypothetical protein
MRRQCLIVLLGCIFIMVFSGIVVAGDYDFEADDGIGDVVILLSGKNTADYPEIDIESAKIEEQGDNVIFTLEVVGSIEDQFGYWYYFDLESVGDPAQTKKVWYQDKYGFTYGTSTENYVENSTDDGILTMVVPKNYISDVTTPWNVTANAEIQGQYLDSAVLSSPSTNGDGDGDGDTTDGNGKKDGGTPGFEIITVILASLVFILIWQRRSR